MRPIDFHEIRHGRVFIIAEACDNHMGDMDAAREMALRAKLAGADAVKFQHHLPDEEMLPDAPMSDNFNIPLYEFLKRHALTLSQHAELIAYCSGIGITYLCTPFSLAAARELETLDVEAYKIGSGEMTDIPTLTRIAAFGKPMIVSTGMAEWEEMDRTYEVLTGTGVPLALTHCLSEYPPRYEDVNLGLIPLMRARYPKALIGHSDHTPDIHTCLAATALGARIIEKHVILEKRQPGPDQSVSIDFAELATLCDGVRKIEAALGSEKKVHDRERPVRAWAFRSIVSTRPIRQGERITQDMVWSKRPGTGIPSHRMDEVVGRTAARDIEANFMLAWEDLEGGS